MHFYRKFFFLFDTCKTKNKTKKNIYIKKMKLVVFKYNSTCFILVIYSVSLIYYRFFQVLSHILFFFPLLKNLGVNLCAPKISYRSQKRPVLPWLISAKNFRQKQLKISLEYIQCRLLGE